MTNPLPDLEPAALETATRAIAGPSLDSDSPASIAEAAIRAYLSARSAPEAGKAVDETLTALAGFLVFLKDMRFTGSWDVPTLNRAIEVGETIAVQSLAPQPVAWETFSDAAYFDMWCVREKDASFGDGYHVASEAEAMSLAERLSALASVPAPSGAEPVAFIVERLDGTKRYVALAGAGDPRHSSYWVNEERRAEYRVTPLYAATPAPQAVPAEDIAGLVERLSNTDAEESPHHANAHMERAAAMLTVLSADLEWWQTVKHSSHWKDRATTSEAEAADLRRKLEEARAGLEEARFEAQHNAELWGAAEKELAQVREQCPLCRRQDYFEVSTLDLVKAQISEMFSWQSRAETAERKLEEHRKALERLARLTKFELAGNTDREPWKSALDLAARTLSGASE